jgi:hypothetical protein
VAPAGTDVEVVVWIPSNHCLFIESPTLTLGRFAGENSVPLAVTTQVVL